MAREAGVVVVLDDGVSRDECFDDDILNGPPYLLDVIAVGLHVQVEGGEFPEKDVQGIRQAGELLPVSETMHKHGEIQKLLEMKAPGAGLKTTQNPERY